MFLEISPKVSISSFMGFLKGKISLMIYGKWGILNSNIETESFGAEDTTWIQQGKMRLK